MSAKPNNVEDYLSDGCGRCSLGGTPDCKVHTWTNGLKLLRSIVLSCGLEEHIKWGAPCYSIDDQNVLMISALKAYFALSFFKGSLIQDDEKLLQKPGENSQAARLFKFTSIDQVSTLEASIKAYIYEAVEIERAGLKVAFKQSPEAIPEEFEERLQGHPDLHEAFYALTPGRQRGYILHFSQPKQSKTRASRIEKCIPKIMSGLGFHDR